MTPRQREELENIRRAAESGLRAAQYMRVCRLVDTCQHILDVYARIIAEEQK